MVSENWTLVLLLAVLMVVKVAWSAVFGSGGSGVEVGTEGFKGIVGDCGGGKGVCSVEWYEC